MNSELKFISEAYRGMLQPKAKLSITEEQLDRMTQEEFDAIDEDQLDELSKTTLGSYIKKVGAAYKSGREKELASHADISDGSDPKAQHQHSDKANAHRLGMMRAKKKVNGDKSPTLGIRSKI